MKHILMVDDVATNLICAVEVLKDQYKITTAKSGMQALELLKEITPDLILLDVNMPQMDGFEVYEWLLSKSEFSHIPVIFLTAETNREKEMKGLTMGAADFIHKPYEPGDFCNRIEKALVQKKERKQETSEVLVTYEEQKKQLEKEVARAEAGFFILLLINRFEEITENYGKLIGEDILYKIIKVLKEELGEENSIYCLENGRFSAFLPKESEREQIKTIVRRMIASVEFEADDMFPEEFGVKISMSAGIASKPADGHDYAELYDCADKALYFLKQSGKRGYYFYSTEQDENRNAGEEKEPIYVLQLQRLFRECKEDFQEAAILDKACQLLSNHLKSKKQKAQLLWLKITKSESDEEQTYALELLEKVIEDSLRKGDIAIPCCGNQYLLILMNASKESGDKVTERIRRKWKEALPDSGLLLTDEIRSI